jgi:hypothetical protein
MPRRKYDLSSIDTFLETGAIPEPNTGCYLWEGCTTKNGYGIIKHKQARHNNGAHRVAWELANGPIPDGLLVLHRCDTPLCVNPKHLFLGTHQDNMADMHAKRRGSKLRGEQKWNAKLTEDDVREIRAAYRNGNTSRRKLAAQFGMSRTHIGNIVRGEKWKHVAEPPPTLPTEATRVCLHLVQPIDDAVELAQTG